VDFDAVFEQLPVGAGFEIKSFAKTGAYRENILFPYGIALLTR
jgi:hypothetical protein